MGRTAVAAAAQRTPRQRAQHHGAAQQSIEHVSEHSSTAQQQAQRSAAGAHDVADLLLPQPHVGVEHAVVELLLVCVDQLPHLQVQKKVTEGRVRQGQLAHANAASTAAGCMLISCSTMWRAGKTLPVVCTCSLQHLREAATRTTQQSRSSLSPPPHTESCPASASHPAPAAGGSNEGRASGAGGQGRPAQAGPSNNSARATECPVGCQPLAALSPILLAPAAQSACLAQPPNAGRSAAGWVTHAPARRWPGRVGTSPWPPVSGQSPLPPPARPARVLVLGAMGHSACRHKRGWQPPMATGFFKASRPNGWLSTG